VTRRRVNPDDAAARGDLMPGDGGPYFKLSERTELTDEEKCLEAFDGCGCADACHCGDDGVAADAETAAARNWRRRRTFSTRSRRRRLMTGGS
jgi:hypothetical protein